MTTKTRSKSKQKKIDSTENTKIATGIIERGASGLILSALGEFLKPPDQSNVFESSRAEIRGAINEQCNRLNNDDMGPLVAMLHAQTVALDLAFVRLMGQTTAATNTQMLIGLMTTAMKVQSNCRQAALAICELRHPRQSVNFIKTDQANLTTGNQQVNNYPANTHAQDNTDPDNKLLEATHHERMDRQAQSATGPTNSRMATLAEIDRPTH